VIPVCEPNIGPRELEYVTECVRSGWISSKGEYVRRFEEAFSAFCGVSHGVSCTSGTTALHLAVASLGIGKGDEVILPSHTMIATCNAVLYTGAKPVLVDSELETWNLDPEKVIEKVTPRTKAILPVHTYGHPCEMDALGEIAEDHHLDLIEDAAEAHGAEYRGEKIGSMGRMACFSFYANKIITTGEGGIVVTDDRELAKLCRTLMNHAFSEERHFWHQHIGFNYRMTNLQAAVGLAQMERIDEFIEAKRRNAALYKKHLQGIPGIHLPPEKPWVKNVYWMFGLLLDEEYGMSRDDLQARLLEKGIETRTFFIPMHQQPVYREMGLFIGEEYPIADRLGEWGLYLPSSTTLKEEEIRYIADSVRSARDGD
jgi:perosamine synthetase